MPNVNIENRIFESFKVADKIEDLKNWKRCDDLSVFDGKTIVIAVPSFDESSRHIESHDPQLFFAQEVDAKCLADFIMSETKASSVKVLTDSNMSDEVVDSSIKLIDFLFLLHEFIPSEKRYIVDCFREDSFGNINNDLQVIELY